MRRLGDVVSAVLIGALLGVVIGVAGSFVIRVGGDTYVGLVISLLAFFAAALFCRTIAGPAALVSLYVAMAVSIGVVVLVRPGGDIILIDDLRTYIWIGGAAVLALTAAALPTRWFENSRLTAFSNPEDFHRDLENDIGAAMGLDQLDR